MGESQRGRDTMGSLIRSSPENVALGKTQPRCCCWLGLHRNWASTRALELRGGRRAHCFCVCTAGVSQKALMKELKRARVLTYCMHECVCKHKDVSPTERTPGEKIFPWCVTALIFLISRSSLIFLSRVKSCPLLGSNFPCFVLRLALLNISSTQSRSGANGRPGIIFPETRSRSVPSAMSLT